MHDWNRISSFYVKKGKMFAPDGRIISEDAADNLTNILQRCSKCGATCVRDPKLKIVEFTSFDD